MGPSQGTMNNLTFGNAKYQYYETICSGSPAGPGFDGTSGVHVHMTNTRLTDPEILELRYPVLLEEFGIRRGSGGKGKWSAGDGTLRRIRFLERMDCAILSSFRKVRPYGLEGGEAGECGENWVRRNDGTHGAAGGLRPDRAGARRGRHHQDADRRRIRQAVTACYDKCHAFGAMLQRSMWPSCKRSEAPTFDFSGRAAGSLKNAGALRESGELVQGGHRQRRKDGDHP